MNDILKSLPKGLLADVRAMMEASGHAKPEKGKGEAPDAAEKSYNVHSKKWMKSDINKCTSVAEEAGDLEEVSSTTLKSYASKADSSRAKGIATAYKKMQGKGIQVPAKMEEVEADDSVEQIDELSKDTLMSYKKKAEADPAFEKRKGKISHARKAVMAKRTAGIAKADKGIAKHRTAEFAQAEKERADTADALHAHFLKHAPGVLAKHGYTKTAEGSKYDTYTKPHETGHQFHVSIAKQRPERDRRDGSPAEHKITNTSGWSGDRHKTHDHLYWSRHDGKTLGDWKKESIKGFDDALKSHHERRHNDMLRESVIVDSDVINEALEAADRYNDHHSAIKTLLKSISQHLDEHKAEATGHIGWKGKKGPHWGHVGDVAHIHSQVSEIHDQLARKGEYAEAANTLTTEEVTLSQEELDFLAQLNTAEVELDEARGRPARAVVNQGFTIHPNTKEKLMHDNPEHMARIERLIKNKVIPRPKTEASQHIMQQLQKAKVSMTGAGKVNFHNGETHEVKGSHAAKLIDKYSAMKPHEKEAFQKRIHVSHKNMMDELK